MSATRVPSRNTTRTATRAPALGLPLQFALVVIASAVLSVVLNHAHDRIPAEHITVSPSPSSMF